MLRQGQQEYTDPSSAACYHKNNAVQYGLAEAFMHEYSYLMTGSVLDIGSGDGKVTAFIANHFKTAVTGVDISSERVAFAIETYSDERLHFVQGNAISMHEIRALSMTKFDTAVSFNVLHHIPKTLQPQAMRNIHEKLKDNGVALFLVPTNDSSFEADIDTVMRRSEWLAYFHDFDINLVRTYESPEYYLDLCRDAGFEYCLSVKQDIGTPSQTFTPESLAEFMRGWLPHLVHLKDQLDCEVSYNALADKFLLEVATECLKPNTSDPTKQKRGTMNRIIASTNREAFFTRSQKVESEQGEQPMVSMQVHLGASFSE